MKIIITIILLSPLMLSMTSCNSFVMGKDYEYHEGWARVDEHIVGSECEIISVDGQPVTRLKHGHMVTVAPHVVIPEGEHTIVVRVSELGLDKPRNSITTEMKISVEKDGWYRLEESDGVLALADISDKK